MKQFKARFLILCGLVILSAASLAPIVAQTTCPPVKVACPDGTVRSCTGTIEGDKCVYSLNCLTCGRSGTRPSPE
jgi:hypothetical protein